MAKRRTKKDKSEARTKRGYGETVGMKLSLNFEKLDRQKNIIKSGDFEFRELQLPIRLIKADLTRTLLVTILALFLQIGLYVYFQKGAFAKLLPILSKVSL
jgi:hypothetical protein